MKTQRQSLTKRGFTLMELMVAMVITTIIVTVLVSITSIAMDTWNRSRAELRAARQAKAMVDTMARDLEALVSRSANDFEWLAASRQDVQGDTPPLEGSNAAELVFFTSATDRYNGEIGPENDEDKGGDVSCVAYSLDYRDPLDDGGNFPTYVLNRLLVNPDTSFTELLGSTDLSGDFAAFRANISDSDNFVCENVYQFTLTFHLETTDSNGVVSLQKVTMGDSGTSSVDSFKVRGNGIVLNPAPTTAFDSARIKSVEISITVLSDAGINQLRNRTFSGDQQQKFIATNGFNYSKLVQVPGM